MSISPLFNGNHRKILSVNQEGMVALLKEAFAVRFVSCIWRSHVQYCHVSQSKLHDKKYFMCMAQAF